MDPRGAREFARARPVPARAIEGPEVETVPAPAPEPELSTASRVLAIQGAVGNATVSRLLAPTGADERVRDEATPAADPSAVVARGGSPLESGLRTEMEGAFGADLSTVRVHDGAEASESARALGARAYTVGEDIVVGDGSGDRRTMAHELAHVVQQRAGAVDGTPTEGGFSVSSPDDRFERAASVAADTVLGSGAETQSADATPGAAGSPPVQRVESGEEP